MSDFWKPVDDRYPADRELVLCHCAGTGDVFYGFCIRPYSDSGKIKNWYVQSKINNWHPADKIVTHYHRVMEDE